MRLSLARLRDIGWVVALAAFAFYMVGCIVAYYWFAWRPW